MPVEERKRDFQSIEQEYDALYRESPVRDEDRAYTFHVQNILREKPEAASFLDVACGGGYFLRELDKARGGAGRYYGTDISAAALELARKECPRGKFEKAVAESLPYENATFDAISCLGSMEHFLDIPKSIHEMRRVAKKDALFYILVPNIFWYKDLVSVLMKGIRLTRNQTHERFSSLGEWVELLEENGLRVTKVQKYNGIARSPLKQWWKDLLLPLKFSYHFIFYCRQA